ncbi:hypothetical protein GFS60_05693 [Rhodococcus sp. WAY2]|nr:hypothetical protein GFS60_05693 [Rhodococcus sp. WAY2]
MSLLGCVPGGLVGRRMVAVRRCDVGLIGQLREPLLSAMCKERAGN